jgi:hypothetical protein
VSRSPFAAEMLRAYCVWAPVMREMGSEYMSLRSTSLLSRPPLLLRHSSVIVIIKSYLLLWYIHHACMQLSISLHGPSALRGRAARSLCLGALSNADITRLIAPAAAVALLSLSRCVCAAFHREWCEGGFLFAWRKKAPRGSHSRPFHARTRISATDSSQDDFSWKNVENVYCRQGLSCFYTALYTRGSLKKWFALG